MLESESSALPLGDTPLFFFKKDNGFIVFRLNCKNLFVRSSKDLNLFMGLNDLKIKWGGRWDSNPRQPEPQSGALPLNYAHHTGASQEIRTPGPRLRRAMLYPAELVTQKNGAGEGNRTLTTSLEGWDSTFELHPLERKTRFELATFTLAR